MKLKNKALLRQDERGNADVFELSDEIGRKERRAAILWFRRR